MSSQSRTPIVIDRFYEALDENVIAELAPQHKQAIEEAIISVTLASRHRVDIRRGFPFFGKRYYMVFLLGRDLRKRIRPESKLSRIVVTFLILFATLFFLFCILLTLYMIKSALGIDVFQHFHVGIWDWWLNLRDR
ncbi:hypothetical protein M8013_00410 [Enterobacteriaceae bacterium H4N4]|uniref:3-phosphoshikimate 1-carboxyvinyltransferase n=1 Tax=Silvania confinis TaxID=2926470 RepID=A0A9J6Q3P0_9ENTR|nr:hypothetical protein [Silvania confinis]MCU6667223.1 hypothetical protein [Silvania confinis]